jgi:hypothetical protein
MPVLALQSGVQCCHVMRVAGNNAALRLQCNKFNCKKRREGEAINSRHHRIHVARGGFFNQP